MGRWNIAVNRNLAMTALLFVMAVTTPAYAANRDKALSARMDRIADQLHVPGYSVAIVQDGKVIYRHVKGLSDVSTDAPVTSDSLFGIASVTKSMTGIMMEQLESEAQIKLDDPLLAYPLNASWHPPEGIGDPNITLADVLSMSAGDVPGQTYVYNGARFNLLSGVFDKVSKTDSPQSYVIQNRRRILEPLGMVNTMAGFQKDNPLSVRAVKRYEAQASKTGWNYVERPYDWDAAYPASGLISTIDDLAKYAAALDRNTLIDQAGYDRLTAPRNGHPYGLGWFTQKYAGLTLHWVFGYGQAESAVFLRVPEKKLTFIFLSNADTPSALAQLDYANVARQPFAFAFLDGWVNGDKAIDFDKPVADITRNIGSHPSPMTVEALFNEALLQTYRAKMTGADSGRAMALTELLYQVAPERFKSGDVYMLRLLSDVSSSLLDGPAHQLVSSFDYDTDLRPVVPFWGGNVLERYGDVDGAMKLYEILCDRPGFDDEPMKAQGCERLGQHELKTGQIADGRKHIWHSAMISRHMNDWREYDRKIKLIMDSKG